MDDNLVIPQRDTNAKPGTRGRPRKRLVDGPRGVGRPRRYERDENVQPRERLRARKTRFVAEPSDRKTRLDTGALKRKKARGRPPQNAPRRYRRREHHYIIEDDDEGENYYDIESDDNDDDDMQELHRMPSPRPGGPNNNDPFLTSSEDEEVPPPRRRPRRDIVYSSPEVEPGIENLANNEQENDPGLYIPEQNEPGYMPYEDDLGYMPYENEPDQMSEQDRPLESPQQADDAPRVQTESPPRRYPLEVPQMAPEAAEEEVVGEEEAVELVRRRPQDMIPAGPNFAGIRSLYWTAQNEWDFQQLWDNPLPYDMYDDGNGEEAEMRLWKTMLICFNATPVQLFTYGLKLHPHAYVSGASLRWKPEFSDDLGEICTHPFWGGDMNKLRFVLQAVVCARQRNHVEPIVPSFLNPRDPGITSLVETMTKIAEDKDKRAGSSAAFELDEGDLPLVIEALNRTKVPGRWWLSSDVKEHNQRFHRFYDDVFGDIRPRDHIELEELIWLSEKSEKRDFEIRRAIKDANAPGEFLFDVPNFGQHTDNAPPHDHKAAELLRGDIITGKRNALNDACQRRRGNALANFSATVKRVR
ncbi:hypothetical protein F4805DRAFT_438170 [Annulohypoxylon moriforme]|nr:hypothetical protein F4805DRAFT_438170 [Annulohypoxylon moriforme]